MALYLLTTVSPLQFAEILKDEPKQLGKPMLKALPAIWCPKLWMEKAERWYWPDWHMPPTVQPKAPLPPGSYILRAFIEV